MTKETVLILLILSFLCFILDALGLSGRKDSASRISLTPLGLALWVLYAIIRTVGAP